MCPWSRWIWSATRDIAALAQMNPGSSNSIARSPWCRGRRRRAFARDAQVEALPRDGRDHREPAARAGARGGLRTPRPPCAGPPRRRPRLSIASTPSATADPPCATTDAAAAACAGSMPPDATTRGSPRLVRTSTTAPTAPGSSSATPTNSRASRSGMSDASTSRRTTASSASCVNGSGPAAPAAVDGGAHGAYLRRVGLGAERREQWPRDVQAAQCRARRAGPRGQLRQGQVAGGGLVALAQQLEDVGALGEVVVRRGGLVQARVDGAAHTQELAPVGGRRPRIEPRFDGAQALAGFFRTSRRQQRLTGGQVGLNGVGRRNVGRPAQLVGEQRRRLRTRRGAWRS